MGFMAPLCRFPQKSRHSGANSSTRDLAAHKSLRTQTPSVHNSTVFRNPKTVFLKNSSRHLALNNIGMTCHGMSMSCRVSRQPVHEDGAGFLGVGIMPCEGHPIAASVGFFKDDERTAIT